MNDILTKTAHKKEMILAVPNNIIQSFLDHKNGCILLDEFSKPKFIDLLNKQYIFKFRLFLETDLNYKQIIPYIIIKVRNKYLNYSRAKQSGDIRLHHKRSIGVGGHINISDFNKAYLYNTNTNSLYSSFNDILYYAIRRELREELSPYFFDQYNIEFSDFYVINSHEDDISKHHLGIVYICNILNYNNNIISQLTDTRFDDIRDLEPTKYELWSSMMIEILKGEVNND